MTKLSQAKVWLKLKHPDANLSDSETLIKWLNVVKDTRIQNQAEKINKLINSTEPCPTCGHRMVRIRLCGACELSHTPDKWKAMEICPQSIGVNQKANTMEMAKRGDKRYADYLLLLGIDPMPIICDQTGILTKEYDD